MKIIKDLKAMSKGSKIRMISVVFFNPSFHAVLLYRISHFLGKTSLFLPIVKLIMYINRVLYSVDIDYRADLAGGFNLAHGIGTVIGYDVKTEGPVNIYQGVTLGGNSNKRKTRNGRTYSQPWLGKNVTIYANSTIIGPCYINNNSIIGASTIITKDIEENTLIHTTARYTEKHVKKII